MSNKQSKVDFKKIIVESFNQYTGENTEVLDKLYDDDVVFEDPLIKVSGLTDLKKYYKHAYSQVKSIEFDFKAIHPSGLTYCCEWDMTFSVTALNFGKPYTVRGASVITFSKKSDKVISHHDYLDIGEMVYEKIPGVGKLVRLMKSRLS